MNSSFIRVHLRFRLSWLGILLLGPSAFALGPHEILLLANRNSPRSMELARDYAALRHVPDPNIVALDLPAPCPLELSPDEFTRRILEPALRQCRERGLENHILAWVYSVDFPIRITASPPLSIQGITFLRGRLPGKEAVEKATYTSPLFAGPDAPTATGFPSQSLDVQRAWIGKGIPLPSMMLGFMGPHGNSREDIMACLTNGTRADKTRPDGWVCLVTNTDVRSLCRQWEFAPAARELEALGVRTVITNAFPQSGSIRPDGSNGLIGLMGGAADIPGLSEGPLPFRPGAMADHLTSFGAAFEHDDQTKISAWITAGATATAGTVTEPMSLWAKFPNARLFVHPVAGCTLLESYYQAIRCPLQILIIGDPLASPWAPVSTLTLEGLPGGLLSERRTITAAVRVHNNEFFNRFLFLLDGKPFQAAGKTAEVTLDPATLKPGRHQLRVVASTVGSVRSQIFSESEFEVK